MSNNQPDDESTDSQQGSEQQPADSDQPSAQAEEQPTDQAGVSTEQPQAQPADAEQATTEAEDQPSQNGQPADQQEDQSTAEADQPTAQSDQVAEAEGQQTDESDDGTAVASGDTGTGVQARPSPKPKRSPTIVKRRFVFRFATIRSGADRTPPALVSMVDNALAGGLLAFRIEEVVSGKTVPVGREIGAAIPKPTLPAPSDATKDYPGDLVYHFNTVGMDVSITLSVTPPVMGNDFSSPLEKVITRTDWMDNTEPGLSEPTFFVNGGVYAGYVIVPVSEGDTFDNELKARKLERSTIFYISDPRPQNDALHTMDYDVLYWEILASISGDRLTPK